MLFQFQETITKKIRTSTTEHLPLSGTYNRTLPDLETLIDKNWHILQIEAKSKKLFADPPILALKKNKNLKGIIGGNKVSDNKKIIERKEI